MIRFTLIIKRYELFVEIHFKSETLLVISFYIIRIILALSRLTFRCDWTHSWTHLLVLIIS